MAKYIPLHGKHGNGKVAIVDDNDFLKFCNEVWYLDARGYVVRWIGNFDNRICVRLHREIAQAPDNMIVDHANRNPLDNRRANLRVANRSQNNRNSFRKNGTSQYKGVHWHKTNGKWIASINLPNRKGIIYLGSFDSEIEAAKVYDEAARKYHGDFAFLNFP